MRSSSKTSKGSGIQDADHLCHQLMREKLRTWPQHTSTHTAILKFVMKSGIRLTILKKSSKLNPVPSGSISSAMRSSTCKRHRGHLDTIHLILLQLIMTHVSIRCAQPHSCNVPAKDRSRITMITCTRSRPALSYTIAVAWGCNPSHEARLCCGFAPEQYCIVSTWLWYTESHRKHGNLLNQLKSMRLACRTSFTWFICSEVRVSVLSCFLTLFFLLASRSISVCSSFSSSSSSSRIFTSALASMCRPFLMSRGPTRSSPVQKYRASYWHLKHCVTCIYTLFVLCSCTMWLHGQSRKVSPIRIKMSVATSGWTWHLPSKSHRANAHTALVCLEVRPLKTLIMLMNFWKVSSPLPSSLNR